MFCCDTTCWKVEMGGAEDKKHMGICSPLSGQRSMHLPGLGWNSVYATLKGQSGSHFNLDC